MDMMAKESARCHSNHARVAVDECDRSDNNGIESHASKPGYKDCVCDDLDVEAAAES